MEQIKDFKLDKVRVEDILFVLTSDSDYEESRVIFVENYSDYGSYLLLDGGHCSCYGWSEVTWDATILTTDELKKLLPAWDKQEYGLEPEMAKLIRKHFVELGKGHGRQIQWFAQIAAAQGYNICGATQTIRNAKFAAR